MASLCAVICQFIDLSKITEELSIEYDIQEETFIFFFGMHFPLFVVDDWRNVMISVYSSRVSQFRFLSLILSIINPLQYTISYILSFSLNGSCFWIRMIYWIRVQFKHCWSISIRRSSLLSDRCQNQNGQWRRKSITSIPYHGNAISTIWKFSFHSLLK